MANTKHGIVVVLDVLGARAFSSEEAEKFVDKRDELLQKTDQYRDDMKHIASGAVPNCIKPEITTFGDTIVLSWEVPDTKSAMLLWAVSYWLRAMIFGGLGLKNPIALRGAISIGDYIKEKSTLIGPAVADAASWYEQSQWLGVMTTPSCSLKWEAFVEATTNQDPSSVAKIPLSYVKYQIPLKDGKCLKSHAVSWPALFFRAPDDRPGAQPRAFFLTLLSRFPIPFGTEIKYTNTIKFFDRFVKKYGNLAEKYMKDV
jgi:hypothetical protein